MNEEQVRLNKRNIIDAKENLAYEEKMLKLKLKKVRPLNPQFEYEIDEDFLKLRKELMVLEFQRKKEEILYAIHATEKENEKLRKQEKPSYVG